MLSTEHTRPDLNTCHLGCSLTDCRPSSNFSSIDKMKTAIVKAWQKLPHREVVANSSLFITFLFTVNVIRRILLSNVDSNKLWHDVQHEETVIYAKFGKDLFNISKVTGRKTKWPRFFGLPGIAANAVAYEMNGYDVCRIDFFIARLGEKSAYLHQISLIQLRKRRPFQVHVRFTAEVEWAFNKKLSCRYDSRPYCFTADYLVISDCC